MIALIVGNTFVIYFFIIDQVNKMKGILDGVKNQKRMLIMKDLDAEGFNIKMREQTKKNALTNAVPLDLTIRDYSNMLLE